MEISTLSQQYHVRRLTENDKMDIFELCRKNTLYYEHRPPFVSLQSIAKDMYALPPDITDDDKYYVGYYDEEKLIAVMDLIMGYPDQLTAFIGFYG